MNFESLVWYYQSALLLNCCPYIHTGMNFIMTIYLEYCSRLYHVVQTLQWCTRWASEHSVRRYVTYHRYRAPHQRLIMTGSPFHEEPLVRRKLLIKSACHLDGHMQKFRF